MGAEITERGEGGGGDEVADSCDTCTHIASDPYKSDALLRYGMISITALPLPTNYQLHTLVRLRSLGLDGSKKL